MEFGNSLYFILGAVSGFVTGGVFFVLFIGNKYKLQLAETKAKYDILQTSVEENKKYSEHVQKSFNHQFENLAQKIFEEKSSKFTDQNQKQLASILDPLKERIRDFEKKVEDTYSQERFERGHLKGEISKLIELNHTMSKEAHNLVLALKGENKTQGNWGELILENILERSGLRKNEEYLVQETVKGLNGEILRPDVVVRLPDGKHIIVDSKMTLTAYEAYCSSQDEVQRERFAVQHVESLKRHIQDLSDKKYHLAEQVISPDFVILFMPLEPAFALAFQLKPDLFDLAWQKNVAIVSPTTLLATLRTVSSLWKQERQQKNALEIAKRGGDLYDKFVGIVQDLDRLGSQFETARKTHSDIIGKISTGRGNLISQVEKLKELGAKADKSLPEISS